jgi:hypothetical protein
MDYWEYQQLTFGRNPSYAIITLTGFPARLKRLNKSMLSQEA